MIDTTNAECPRVEDVSALMDGALSGSAADEVSAHVGRCPLCGALLRDFDAMSARMQRLRDTRCDVDIASLVAPQLPPRAQGTRKRQRSPSDIWSFAPRGLAAAGALAAGAYLGLILASGATVAVRPAAITVFDATPPGALCVGLPACTPRGR
jgi:anti-sigma factor RsiW